MPGAEHYLANGLWHHNSGKTDACAAYFDRMLRQNKGWRGAIVAPTLGDAIDACVYGPSGLLAHNPTLRCLTHRGGTFVYWPNGSQARLFGAYSPEDVERLRAGGNRNCVWLEELAAWRHLEECWDHVQLGLRLGEWPHAVASTTPKPRPGYKKIAEDPETVVTRASLHDNPHYPAAQRERLLRRYANTSLWRQEIMGELVEDVEGALWTSELLALARVTPGDVPDLTRVVVAVDPSGGDSEGNDEQGIIVAGRGVDGHGYVVADRSCKMSPSEWGRRAVQAYVDFAADKLVSETNFGGDLVLANVKVAARDMDVRVNVGKIVASRGKAQRAEPIAALYEQGRVHHALPVGEEAELEEQLRTWTPDSGWSPDRLDACVFALSEVMLQEPVGAGRGARPRGRVPQVGERPAFRR